ncbi:hypothetical protein M9435_002154 [Picochlorum sp. BPE23]|nr:hypothetical protein M9435_002154 [Picochlorum sp. BPE23]
MQHFLSIHHTDDQRKQTLRRYGSRVRCQSVENSGTPIRSVRDPMSSIFLPENFQRNNTNIKGVVHFLGGAFAGAAPSSLYSGLIQGLSKAGFLVLSTPYQVTFKHDDCARSLYERFDMLYSEAVAVCSERYPDVSSVPCIAVGHSNGALMHSLMSSMYESRYAASILISFNNREVKEAVPVPLDPLRDVATQLQRQAAGTLEDQSNALETRARDLVRDLTSDIEIETSTSQVGSVLDEVADGNLEFSPSPQENAVLISEGYSVPKTLILQFQDDSIDQSKELFRMLKRGRRRSVTYVSLDYGSHVSPVGPVTSADVQKTTAMCVEYLESRCLPSWMK